MYCRIFIGHLSTVLIIFITKRRQLIKRLALKNKEFFIVLIGYLIIFITKRRQLIKRLALKNKEFFIVLLGYLIFKTTICWKSFYCVAHNYTCCKT